MLKAYSWDTLKTTASVIGINMTPIPQALQRALPDSFAGYHLAKGASFAVARSLVDQVTNGQSELFNMNYVALLDNTAFFGIVSGVVDKTDINNMVYKAIDTTLPISEQLKVDLLDGITISAGSAVAGLLDVSTGNNAVFDFIRRPISTSYRMITGY